MRREWTALINGVLWLNCCPSKTERHLFLIMGGKRIVIVQRRGNSRDKSVKSVWFHLGQMWSCLGCLPPGVPGCMEGWSCQASALPLQESLPPVSIAMWADLFLCLCRKPPCPRWSTRSHTPPLKGDNTRLMGKIFSKKSCDLGRLAMFLKLKHPAVHCCHHVSSLG